MDTLPPFTVPPDSARAFLEQILRTGLMLTDLFDSLLECIPEDTFPGECNAEVLMEMMAGSIAPVVAAAGPRAFEEATSLLGAVGDRTLADLRVAIEFAAEE